MNDEKIFEKLGGELHGRLYKADIQPKFLYHYTNLNSFYKIIQSTDLYLSSYINLNDESEIKYGLDEINKVFNDYNIGDYFRFIEEFVLDNSIYVISFCETYENDYLWKKYADLYKGLALGFNHEVSNPKPNEYPAVTMKIVYGNNEISKFDEYVSSLAKIISRPSCRDKRKLLWEFTANLYPNIPRYKELKWTHELEHRYCMLDGYNHNKIPRKLIRNNKSIMENEVIINLREIILGKDCEIEKHDIHNLLRSHGYDLSRITLRRI